MDVKSLLAIIALCACSDPPAKPDAAVDSAVDGKTADAGRCGADVPLTAEHLDWDTTDAAFCGVFQATWTVRGSTNPLETAKTPPNGRVVLCIPDAARTTIDVTPATAASQCAMTGGTYPLHAVAVIDRSVEAMLSATSVFRGRSFTGARETSFYTQIGAAYDPGKGALLVHVAGTPHPVAISGTHDATQRFDGSSWAAGDTGIDVYFPNVPVGTTTITGAAGTIGGGSVPIEANTVTFATLYSPT